MYIHVNIPTHGYIPIHVNMPTYGIMPIYVNIIKHGEYVCPYLFSLITYLPVRSWISLLSWSNHTNWGSTPVPMLSTKHWNTMPSPVALRTPPSLGLGMIRRSWPSEKQYIDVTWASYCLKSPTTFTLWTLVRHHDVKNQHSERLFNSLLLLTLQKTSQFCITGLL